MLRGTDVSQPHRRYGCCLVASLEGLSEASAQRTRDRTFDRQRRLFERQRRPLDGQHRPLDRQRHGTQGNRQGYHHGYSVEAADANGIALVGVAVPEEAPV